MRPIAAVAALALTTSVSVAARAFDPEAHAAELEARSPVEADALAEATVLRLGLGHHAQADADGARLHRDHAASRPDLVARVTLARARLLAGLGEWDALHALLQRSLPELDRRGALDDRLEARALLSRALVQLDRGEEASARRRHIVALGEGGSPGARGREALAEARFELAEIERRRAEAVTLSPYAGKGDHRSVDRYLAGPAERWIERRLRAVRRAEIAYFGVLGIKRSPPRVDDDAGGDPTPPTVLWEREQDDPYAPSYAHEVPSPRWAIAALARVAMTWVTFLDIAARLPVRPPLHGPVPGAPELTYEDLRSTWGNINPTAWLDDPTLYAARPCAAALRLALQHRVADEHTRTCEVWLSRHFGAEWKILDELRPRVAAPFAAGPFSPVTRGRQDR